MADQPKNEETQVPNPEELKQEEEALKEHQEADIRSETITKFELDEDSQGDLIDKLTQEALEQKKSFSKLVRQKRDWRDKANAAPPAKEEDVGDSDNSTNKPDTLTREEAILLAKGMDEADLNMLKKLAAINESTILEAQDDPVYESYMLKKVADKKSAEAELGASGGSGAHSDGRVTPGMSEEDHRKLWREQTGQ